MSEEKPKEILTRVVWTFHREVLKVTEVEEHYNHRKADPTKDPSEQNMAYDIRTIGWQVRISDGSAIGLFPENPGYKPGDELEMTITRKRAKP
jgi:hypothetical protein